MNNQKGASGKRRNRRRKKILLKRLILFFIIIVCGYYWYTRISKPYTIGIDAGHGGDDVGAVGLIEEAKMTEETARDLENLLKEDGRFRVVLSRKYGETKNINDRNRRLARAKPDIVLSIHGNSDDLKQGTGFECYPTPPGRENHGVSVAFAKIIGESMAAAGSSLRGIEGIRYGYYISDSEGNSQKVIMEASDETVYEYSTFGIIEGFSCPSVLVEQCFVSNEADVAAFADEEGCKKAADAYYKSICRYLGVTPNV